MNPKNIAIGVIALAVIGIAALQFGGQDARVQNSTQDMRDQMQNRMGDQNQMMRGGMMNRLRNGTYEAVGSYQSPAGPETIGVTVTLDGNVITDASVEVQAEHPTSKKLQGLFEEGFAEEVVGKEITEVQLDVVNGSSLTPQGFNDALEQIIDQAAEV